MTDMVIPTLEECVLDPRAGLPAQPDYHIPEAFEPVWFTYRRPTVPMAPHHLFTYHALSENQTLVYHFDRISDTPKIDNAARLVRTDRQNGRTFTLIRDLLWLRMDKSIESHPLDEETREKIFSWCQTPCKRGDISDAAYFPNIQGPPSKPFMAYMASFAQFYFMNEFYESEIGNTLTQGMVDPGKGTMIAVVPKTPRKK